MAPRVAIAAAPPRPPDPLVYAEMVALYDRRTRAAYDVMGLRWNRFCAAKDAFLAATPGTRTWYGAAERAYRLGLRSTHAYYLWTRGHTALSLNPAANGAAAAATRPLRLRLGEQAQGLRP